MAISAPTPNGDTAQQPMHILIIGAGIAGLTLAQSLVRHNTTLPAERRIKFTVFERDESAGFRPQGWGISLHSTLTVLEDHIPAEVYDAICEAQVNPAAGRNEVRGVPYVNLDTGVVEHNVPKSKRLRLRRDQVRLGLTKGLDIQWGKRLVSIAKTAEGTGVVASFEDGTSFVGTHVVGADGAWSGVRRVLAPDTWENRRLPCDAVGTSFYVARDEISKLQNEVDPLYFFGCDPKTNTYCFWSLLEEPGYHFSSPRESAPPPSDDMYKMQLYFSWIPRDREQEQREQVGKSPEEVFREKASTMFPTLRGIVERCMPEDAIVSYVNLVEWPVVAWDNWGGLATLAGDSAHCMSIYRGEGVNHGIIDGCVFADALKRAAEGLISPKQAIAEYEAEMRVRGKEAVDVSREACIDAHDYEKIAREGSFALLGAKKV